MTAYSWDFGDGGGSTDANPSHTYTAAGTYTVTLTTSGPGGSNTRTITDYITLYDANSAHVGINGVPVSSANRIELRADGNWVWTNDTMDGVRATIEVPSPGTHTINVWMREAGFLVDRLWLTPDPLFVPSGG